MRAVTVYKVYSFKGNLLPTHGRYVIMPFSRGIQNGSMMLGYLKREVSGTA
jgi:hypothetical protein